MSAAPQRGRRRAEPERRPSIFGHSSARTGSSAGARARTRAAGQSGAVSAVTTTAKCMAAVAVLGALVAGGAVAQQVGTQQAAGENLSSLVSAASTSTTAPAVSVPHDAAISFSGPSISSSTKPTGAALKAESNDVKADASKSPSSSTAPSGDDPAAAQAYAAGQLSSFGWGADQMSCLTQLWQRESEWLTSAENASSGAYGIAQSLPASKMEATGSDWSTNYETQIRWGMGYIQQRYGSPCGAWGHSNSVGWY